jgi:hypothetical protein
MPRGRDERFATSVLQRTRVVHQHAESAERVSIGPRTTPCWHRGTWKGKRLGKGESVEQHVAQGRRVLKGRKDELIPNRWR